MQLKFSLELNDQQPVKVSKSLNVRYSEFRESSEPIMYKAILLYVYVNWEVSSDPKEKISLL